MLWLQENAELRQTREEFDYRLREMEEAYEKQSKKMKSKDKKVRDSADAESSDQRTCETVCLVRSRVSITAWSTTRSGTSATVPIYVLRCRNPDFIISVLSCPSLSLYYTIYPPFSGNKRSQWFKSCLLLLHCADLFLDTFIAFLTIRQIFQKYTFPSLPTTA